MTVQTLRAILGSLPADIKVVCRHAGGDSFSIDKVEIRQLSDDDPISVVLAEEIF